MGTWSTSLFSNDLACDVRDTYMFFLKQQQNNIEAYNRTYAEYSAVIGTEEEPLFWYALADTQWTVGRLMPEVKKIALELINSNAGKELWEENAQNVAKWSKTLQKLNNKLESPMCSEKNIKKTDEFVHNPWEIGDVYAYKFHTKISEEKGLNGKYILFQKVGDIIYCDNMIFSIIQVYDKIFDIIPEISTIYSIRILPLVTSDIAKLKLVETEEKYIKYLSRFFKAIMICSKKNSYPKKYFTFVGNLPIDKHKFDYTQCTSLYWNANEMDEWLSDFYTEWQDVDY